MSTGEPGGATDGLSRRRMMWASLAAAVAASCERRGIEVEGLSTLQPITPIEDFYKYSCCGTPTIPLDWVLVFAVEGEERARLDQAWLREREPMSVELTLQCIGSSPWARTIGNAVWGGLPLVDVLHELGVTAPDDAVELVLRGEDGYHVGIPVTDLDKPVWLIWKMNGVDLPLDHGAPARLMVPGRYGTTNVKWLSSIDFVRTPHEGYWDPDGWSKAAVYKPNGFIFVPGWKDKVDAPVEVLGTAFAGSDPVVRVELTADGGETWRDAELEYAPGADVWVLWRVEMKLGAGEHELQVRVHTANGQKSTLEPGGTDPAAGFDGGSIVPVTVR